MKLFQIHILQQSSDQAIFTWHRDTEEFERIRLSVVVNLTNTYTTMQIGGRPEFAYQLGTCAIFPSNAIHRSGHAAYGTIKIALFFMAEWKQLGKRWHSTLPCICGRKSLMFLWSSATFVTDGVILYAQGPLHTKPNSNLSHAWHAPRQSHCAHATLCGISLNSAENGCSAIPAIDGVIRNAPNFAGSLYSHARSAVCENANNSSS